MEKYNCIVVFNSNKDQVLFCKRSKEPYKGLYNFVGGRVETGESGKGAAYRELKEETGISKYDIRLHPEVCFARLNGTVVMSKKAHFTGMTERDHILRNYLPELDGSEILSKSKELKCNPDDIVDAICLAVTANLNNKGYGETIPANPMQDDTGLTMQMVIPKDRSRGIEIAAY